MITTLKYKFNSEGFTYDRRPHLFVVAADGGEPQQITDGDCDHTDPTWSPDGALIAFVSARHDDRDYDNAADVWVVSPTWRRAPSGDRHGWSTQSPRLCAGWPHVAYLGHRYRHESGRNMRLYTVSVTAAQPTCLTAALDRTCAPFFGAVGPQWSADGTWLMCAVETQGDIHLYRVMRRPATAPYATAQRHAASHRTLRVARRHTPGLHGYGPGVARRSLSSALPTALVSGN